MLYTFVHSLSMIQWRRQLCPGDCFAIILELLYLLITSLTFPPYQLTFDKQATIAKSARITTNGGNFLGAIDFLYVVIQRNVRLHQAEGR